MLTVQFDEFKQTEDFNQNLDPLSLQKVLSVLLAATGPPQADTDPTSRSTFILPVLAFRRVEAHGARSLWALWFHVTPVR